MHDGALYLHGFLERFPELTLAILESNAGWLPFWLGRMVVHSHGRYSITGRPKSLSMLPTIRRQCTVACDSDEQALEYAVAHLDGDNMVWNTDYPPPRRHQPAGCFAAFVRCRICGEHRRVISGRHLSNQPKPRRSVKPLTALLRPILALIVSR